MALFRVYRNSYTASQINNLCSTDGVLVFDRNTKRIYCGINPLTETAYSFGSNVQDISYNSITSVLTITYVNGTTESISIGSGAELVANKVTSLSSYSTDIQYPSAKCVYDNIRMKPVVVWEAETVSQGFLATESDISQNPNWQITNLDMSDFKTVELYIRSGGTSNISYTSSVVIEIDLDDLNKSSFGHFLGSAIVQNPNDRNRILAVSAAISEDKTSVIFNRCTSLYGTAATSSNTDGKVLYKIIGYYD